MGAKDALVGNPAVPTTILSGLAVEDLPEASTAHPCPIVTALPAALAGVDNDDHPLVVFVDALKRHDSILPVFMQNVRPAYPEDRVHLTQVICIPAEHALGRVCTLIYAQRIHLQLLVPVRACKLY
jgi:hypothetical protein